MKMLAMSRRIAMMFDVNIKCASLSIILEPKSWHHGLRDDSTIIIVCRSLHNSIGHLTVWKQRQDGDSVERT